MGPDDQSPEITNKFVARIVGTKLQVCRRGRATMIFTTVEALMLPDILKNQEEILKKMAKGFSPFSVGLDPQLPVRRSKKKQGV